MATPIPITANLLLRALPEESAIRLAKDLQVRELRLGHEIYDADEKNDVYFPLDGVISILKKFEDGSEIEISMTGPEGAAGLNTMLGVDTNPYVGLVQGRGYAACIKAADIRRHLESDRAMSTLMHRYIYIALSHAAQLAICNRLHVVEQRLAHWLLLLQDRVGADELSLTQEFLSRMLATRRATINEAMQNLEKAGCIAHHRKRVTIVNRAKLEKAACACYAEEVGEYERVLGFPPRTSGRVAPID